MVILIDALVDYPPEKVKGQARRHGTQWCHMVSDESLDELVEFAERLGLRREWLHRGHFNTTPGMRAKAVRMGAEEVTGRELVKRAMRLIQCVGCGHKEERVRIRMPCSKCGKKRGRAI